MSVVVRPAADGDSKAVWTWRNDPVTRAVSVHTDEVPWESHQAWFASVLADPARELLVGVVGDEPVGVVRFDQEDRGRWEVSINLAPTARGRGLAVPLLRAGREWLGSRASEVLALVRADNEPSLRAFRRAGYVERSAADGWVTLLSP